MRFTAAGLLKLADELFADHAPTLDGACRICGIPDCRPRRDAERARELYRPLVPPDDSARR